MDRQHNEGSAIEKMIEYLNGLLKIEDDLILTNSNNEVAVKDIKENWQQLNMIREMAFTIQKKYATPPTPVSRTAEEILERHLKKCNDLGFLKQSSPEKYNAVIASINEALTITTNKIDDFLRMHPEFRCLDVIGKFSKVIRTQPEEREERVSIAAAYDAGWARGHSEGADIENFTNHPNKEQYLSTIK